MSEIILTGIYPVNDYRSYLRHSDEVERKYGLPDKKKYPMPDRDHVMSAIKFFNYVSPADEKELAKSIIARIKEYGITDINVGENNRFGKYYKPDYLEHHGILGMKWGVQNGPPYPLDASDHSASEKKAGWRQSLKEKHEARVAEKTVEKEQKVFRKEIKKLRNSVKSSGWQSFDEIMRVNKASELQKIKDAADDDIVKALAKTYINNNDANKSKLSNLCITKADRLLGPAPQLYKTTVANGIVAAASTKLGYNDVRLLQNEYNKLRKQLDRGKTDYGIPIKKNSAYEDYVQVEKDLAVAKKKYQANLKKYSNM